MTDDDRTREAGWLHAVGLGIPFAIFAAIPGVTTIWMPSDLAIFTEPPGCRARSDGSQV